MGGLPKNVLRGGRLGKVVRTQPPGPCGAGPFGTDYRRTTTTGVSWRERRRV